MTNNKTIIGGFALFMGAAAFCAMSARAASVERVFRPERYSRGDTNVRVQQAIDNASWVWRAGCDQWGGAVFSETRTDPKTLAKMPQRFLRFRREFTATDEPLEIDVSADERFVLLLDGEEIARGPMRGLPNRWHYQSYRVSGLSAGSHVVEAVCWQVGEHAPLAQLSVRGGVYSVMISLKPKYGACLGLHSRKPRSFRFSRTRSS